jgi:hypothetical protein
VFPTLLFVIRSIKKIGVQPQSTLKTFKAHQRKRNKSSQILIEQPTIRTVKVTMIMQVK